MTISQQPAEICSRDRARSIGTNSRPTRSSAASRCASLDVEADEVPLRVEERERQRIGHVADAQDAALAHARPERAGPPAAAAPAGRLMNRGWRWLLQKVHPGRALGPWCTPVAAGRANTTRAPPMTTTVRTAVIARYRRSGSAPHLEDAGDGARAEQGDRQRVHGRDQRADPRVDDPGREKQLERVGRDAEQIEQERHRGVEAAEERQQAGERELRVVARLAPRHRQTIRQTG